MSYIPSGADAALTTPDVVAVLQNPGGGLIVPKPSSFPFVPVVLGLVAIGLLLGGKR